MTDGITLTASIRSNLLSLNNASALLATTSERLSTGKKVNGALDNPSSFFTARGLTNRASDLSSRKDGLGQAISLLQATDKSINSITSLIEQAKATAQSAEEASSAGVSAVSSAKGNFVGVDETLITTIKTEASTAMSSANTAHSASISIDGANNTTDGASHMQHFTGIILTAGDTITYSVNDVYGNADTFVATGTTTTTQLMAGLNTLDGITASTADTFKSIDLVAVGGTQFKSTDTAGTVFVVAMGTATTNAAGTTAALLTTENATFSFAGDGTDLAAAAFGMTNADVTDQSITVNDSVRFLSAAAAQTINQYVASLTASDPALTATYDTDTRKIGFSAANGTQLIFSNTDTNNELSLTQSETTTSVVNLAKYSFDDATAIASTDLLTSAFVGTAINDTLQFGVTGGNVGVAYTITATSTIANLVSAIEASDSSLTAAFNTTTEKIDITAADGTAVTVTSGGTTAAFTAVAFTTAQTTAVTLTSGTAVTFGAAGSAAEVGSLNTDFSSILAQIDKLISDATYKGNNLLKGSNSSVVKFNEDGSSSITVKGLDIGVTSNTSLSFTKDASGYDFTTVGDITQALTDTAAAITQLRSISATFGADMGVIQTRETFTSELVNVLESGAGKLVNANLEEESANMLALQTRQALGIQALSISNQSNQSILSLFR